MQTNQHTLTFKQFLSAFVLIFLISSSSFSYGQRKSKYKSNKDHSKWGIKGGFSFSNFYVDDIEDDTNLRKGFHAGIGGRVPIIGKFIALQPEVLYSNKGITADYATGGQDVRHKFALNYVDVPVMASVKLLGLNVHAGVYGSYLLKGKVSATDGITTAYSALSTDDFNSFDIGYTGGVSFNLGGLGVGARYNYGLREVAKTDLAKAVLGDSKNSSLQLYVSMGIR